MANVFEDRSINSNQVKQPLLNNQADQISQQILNIDAMTINSGNPRLSTNNYKSESQANLDKFMHDFKEGAGSKKNEREFVSVNSLAKDQPKPAESDLEKWDYSAPSDALGCRKVQSLHDYLDVVKTSNQNPKDSFFKLQEEYYS